MFKTVIINAHIDVIKLIVSILSPHSYPYNQVLLLIFALSSNNIKTVKYPAASYGACPNLFLASPPQRGGVFDPRGIRHMDKQAWPHGSLLAEIKIFRLLFTASYY